MSSDVFVIIRTIVVLIKDCDICHIKKTQGYQNMHFMMKRLHLLKHITSGPQVLPFLDY